MAMDTESKESNPRPGTLVGRIKDLLGVGVYLLLLGLLLEGLTLVVRQWISFPISLTTAAQILFTALCVSVCLLGVVWFNRSLNLIKIHLLEGKNELVTVGPFAYVRHPLYATLVMTIPPLLVVWFADLLFVVPWVLILVSAHLLVRLEERKLMQDFGSDYARYRQHVPALFPYKGAGGKRYRGEGSIPQTRSPER